MTCPSDLFVRNRRADQGKENAEKRRATHCRVAAVYFVFIKP